MTWWTLKALPWLKKYWKWLLFPIGILIFIAGYVSRPKPKVLAPELLDHAAEREKIEKRTAGQIVEAKEERDKKLAEVEKEHAETVSKLNAEQRGKMQRLRQNPEELNKFLLQVGKDIRRG